LNILSTGGTLQQIRHGGCSGGVNTTVGLGRFSLVSN